MKWKDWITWVVYIALIILLGILTSCRTQYVSAPEYHSVEVHHHDTLQRTDSVYERDSIYICTRGDTVFSERFSIRYRDRIVERMTYRDSLRVDSVRVPYPVERPLTFWQRTEICLFKVFFIILCVCLAIFFIRFWLRARSNI